MSKYLLAICDDFPTIISTSARNMSEAKDRFMNRIANEYDLDTPIDWESFCNDAYNNGIYIGEITSIEEFE